MADHPKYPLWLGPPSCPGTCTKLQFASSLQADIDRGNEHVRVLVESAGYEYVELKLPETTADELKGLPEECFDCDKEFGCHMNCGPRVK